MKLSKFSRSAALSDLHVGARFRDLPAEAGPQRFGCGGRVRRRFVGQRVQRRIGSLAGGGCLVPLQLRGVFEQRALVRVLGAREFRRRPLGCPLGCLRILGGSRRLALEVVAFGALPRFKLL